MSKTGADHLASQRDGRAVYLDGRRIDQPADHPAFRNAVRSAAALAGGGVIMLPSSVEDFADAELAGLIAKTQMSPTTDAKGRVKLFKLAWDALGSEFASRHVQYEMFYAGAAFVTKGHALRTFDWDRATGLVKDLLARYDLPK